MAKGDASVRNRRRPACIGSTVRSGKAKAGSPDIIGSIPVLPQTVSLSHRMKVVRTELRYCKRDLPREMNRPPFSPVFSPFFFLLFFFSLARSSCLGRFGRGRRGRGSRESQWTVRG